MSIEWNVVVLSGFSVIETLKAHLLFTKLLYAFGLCVSYLPALKKHPNNDIFVFFPLLDTISFEAKRLQQTNLNFYVTNCCILCMYLFYDTSV